MGRQRTAKGLQMTTSPDNERVEKLAKEIAALPAGTTTTDFALFILAREEALRKAAIEAGLIMADAIAENTKLTAERDSLKAKVKRFEKLSEHSPMYQHALDCDYMTHPDSHKNRPCTCGLSDLLKGDGG